MTLIINFSEEKMFMRGDFDVNSVQRNTDALKEAFKQTMLNQENTFRKQVDECSCIFTFGHLFYLSQSPSLSDNV